MPTRQPNVLLIMADQLSASALGCDGHRQIQTPHLDALAACGTRFEQAYCNSPICAPSRASMIAGQYVTRLGSFDNGTPFSSAQPTLLHHLRRAGYECVLSGKAHFIGPDQHHGWNRRLTPEIYPSSCVWTPDWTQGAYHNPGSAVDHLSESGVCKWNLQLDHDEEVHHRSLEALRDFARRGEDDPPWLLCASYTHPHEPFIITQEWWDLYDHDSIDPPAAPAEPFESMHPYNQWLQIHHMIDVYPPTVEAIQNSRHAYYGMVSYFDAKVGSLVAELARLGLDDHTIVIALADHGEMLGEHGMWFKRTFYDASARVPLIWAGPGVAEGQVSTNTVSLVDLAPTLLELAGLEDRDEVQVDLDGRSLLGQLHGDQPAEPGHALLEYCSEGVCQPLRAVVREGLKYVHVLDQPELLFDLNQDPLELDNRIADPESAEVAAELRALVHTGYDPRAVLREVLASQRRRRWLNATPAGGTPHPWDAAPDIDPTETYVRQWDAQETNRRRRVD